MNLCKSDKKYVNIMLEMIIAAVVIIMQWYQLEYSAMPPICWWFAQRKATVLLEIALVCLPNVILVLIFQKWFIALGITSVFCSVWSIANHYVVMFHGAPIAVTELKNMKTAMAVASGYEYALDYTVENLAIYGGVEILCVLVLAVCLHTKEGKWFNWKRFSARAVLLTVNCFFLYACLYGPNRIKPAKVISWSWKDSMWRYGYLSCLVEDVESAMNPYVVPEGYDSKKIQPAEVEKTENIPEVNPDIILILNETFYDLNIYTDVPADQDSMKEFYGIENAVYGNAVIPMKGGGTNNAEFELLTSHSMRLIASAAPFNFVDFEKSDDNLVQYLNSFGYNTYGFHCEPPANYLRNKAYPAMGFDCVLLGEEYFPSKEGYGNRPWTDEGNIKDMLAEYEKAGDDPRFMYLLTFQNHGGYERNEASMDTVHTTRNFGEYTDDVDEFLTSVSMTSKAFADMTEYFKNSDRPVVVCMVGDHAPLFINSLEARDGMTEEEKEIAALQVPYVLWANYDVDFPENTENLSMVDIAPMLVKTAGLPMTSYYQYILELHENVPIRTSSGKYIDAEGVFGTDDAESPYYEMMSQYYYQEYNLLKKGEDYVGELFVTEN